ncbi:MAG: hypothetical protein FIA99_14765 [Ruminiclostridium sp.]|nr:hypothetical protein [Ruminiclostridium sp.]
MHQHDLLGLPAGIETVKHALKILFEKDNVVELRILKTGRTATVSGYFNDLDKLADVAIKYSGIAPAVYVTINPVTPVLLARANNKVNLNVVNTSADEDIVKRCWLPIDLDYDRPAGVSTSDIEHDKTHEKARELIDSLTKMGWPAPIYADSGNGAHLLYRIDLPNTSESAQLVKTCLNALAYLVDHDKIHVDESVFNSSRIWKLYGTKACKGENLPERPHRISKILSIPEEIKTISIDQLIDLSNLAPIPEEPQFNKTSKFDIINWMKKFGLSVKNRITKNNRETYVLNSCPFDSAHKDASITQMNNGALAFNCFKNSCKDHHWKQLRTKFEPNAYSSEHKALKNDNSTTYNQASALIQYTSLPGVELFHDEKKEPYARLPIDGKNMIVPVGGRDFRRWLTRSFFADTGTAPGSDALTSALGVIEAIACYSGKEYELFNRVALYESAIWYDLGAGEAVKILAGKWEFVKEPPILFRRQTHQKSHDSGKIKQNGDVTKVLKYVNIESENEQLLFLVYLISCFVPEIPHPIPVLYGDKGSSKTTALKMVKEIVDPSVLQIISFPHNNTELVQKLYHHYLAPFDNIADLSEGQSDALCRACTGEGVSKRALFTNEEDVIFNYRRCVALNGVNLVADKPDLLDRAILLRMERISKDNRKTEYKIWKEFNEEKGEILGGIFDTLAKATLIKPTIHLEELPRMADFMEWGCAISEALGPETKTLEIGTKTLKTGIEAFKESYLGNIQSQNKEAIDASPVGNVIIKLVEDGFKIKRADTLNVEKATSWKGTASELLSLLEECATFYKINIKSKTWPKTANVLTRRINEIKTNLQEEGINFDARREGKDRARTLCLSQLQGNIGHIGLSSASQTADITKADDTQKTNRPLTVRSDQADDAHKSADDIQREQSSNKKKDASTQADGKDGKDDISPRYGKEKRDSSPRPVTGLEGGRLAEGAGVLKEVNFIEKIEKAAKKWEQIKEASVNSSTLTEAVLWVCKETDLEPSEVRLILERVFKITPNTSDETIIEVNGEVSKVVIE